MNHLVNSPLFQKQIHLKEEVIRAFYRAVQTVKIHHENNRMVIGCAENLVQTIVELAPKEDSLSFRFIQGRLYFQDEKMVYRYETEKLYENLRLYFKVRRLQGILIYVSIKNNSLKEILTFARLLNQAQQEKDPEKWLGNQLAKHHIAWAELIHEKAPPTKREERKERAKRVYARVLQSVKDVADKLTTQKQAGISKVLRMAQGMVDLMMEDEPLFRLLSSIRFHDDYTYVHSVNVAILAMCLGRRIMLSRTSLERLGICGLLHDLGKVMVPPEILNKPGRLTSEEFEEIKKHSLNSARLIARIQASRDRKAKILLSPFEHHLKYDLSGYPQTGRKKPLTLFGRILAIVDVYDAITSQRVYRRSYLSPDRALGMMLDGSGKDFDPVLLKVFINMMGVYPIGTLLKLDQGGMALVIEASGDADGRRPKVMMLEPDGNGGYKRGKVLDLRERSSKNNRYRKNIVRSFHPSHYGIQPSNFLF